MHLLGLQQQRRQSSKQHRPQWRHCKHAATRDELRETSCIVQRGERRRDLLAGAKHLQFRAKFATHQTSHPRRHRVHRLQRTPRRGVRKVIRGLYPENCKENAKLTTNINDFKQLRPTRPRPRLELGDHRNGRLVVTHQFNMGTADRRAKGAKASVHCEELLHADVSSLKALRKLA